MPFPTVRPGVNTGLYCRHCGYDLRGNQKPVCPECGRGFDPADPRTFASRPPSKRKWLKRGLAALATVIVLMASVWGWLYWEWHREQQALAQLSGLKVLNSDTIGPAWLGRTLGPAAFVLGRVSDLHGQYSIRAVPFGALKDVKWLENLDLIRTSISDLSSLAKLTALKILLLSDTKVTNLSPLANLTDLKVLHLSGTQVSDLAPLAKLTGLIYLNLSNTNVSDLTPLAKLTGLKELYLTDTKVSDISPLAKLIGLQQLFLDGTKVTDLATLIKLIGLRVLIVPKETITEIQVQELRHAMPNCTIERK